MLLLSGCLDSSRFNITIPLYFTPSCSIMLFYLRYNGPNFTGHSSRPFQYRQPHGPGVARGLRIFVELFHTSPKAL